MCGLGVVSITVRGLKELKHSKIIAYHLIGAISVEIERLKEMYFYGADEVFYLGLYDDYKAEIQMLKDEIDPEELLFVFIEHYNRHIQCLFDAVLAPFAPPQTDDELDF